MCRLFLPSFLLHISSEALNMKGSPPLINKEESEENEAYIGIWSMELYMLSNWLSKYATSTKKQVAIINYYID